MVGTDVFSALRSELLALLAERLAACPLLQVLLFDVVSGRARRIVVMNGLFG